MYFIVVGVSQGVIAYHKSFNDESEAMEYAELQVKDKFSYEEDDISVIGIDDNGSEDLLTRNQIEDWLAEVWDKEHESAD